MVDLLLKTVGPFFFGLGVSEADLKSYITTLQGYILAVLIALILMLVILILASVIKKQHKRFVRLQAVLNFFLVLVFVVNLVAYGPMHSNISGFLNASKVTIPEETKNHSKEVVKKVGEEGFVLLKNDDSLLPLQDEKNLNVFGWASTAPIYGGTGSGSSDTTNNEGILDSLKNAGYELNSDLTEMYKKYQDGRVSKGLNMKEQDWSLPEPTADYYTDDLMNKAKSFSDVAVVVLGRSGGEGADLPMDMRAIIDGKYNIAKDVSVNPDKYGYFGASYKNNGSTPDFEEGQSYLELSKPEKDMLDTVCKNFDKVVLVVNANNPMELGFADDYKQIKSMIWAPGAGVTGFSALGEILKGEVNPSGRTVDTFVKDLQQTPYINNIGNHAYSNVDDLKKAIVAADESAEGNISFVNYAEGIYTGYKFYETAAEEGFLNYEDTVQYPFGYGLSYTSFTQSMENFKDNGNQLSFDVEVKNTGKVAGKDVVQVYFTPPYYNGGIEKSTVNFIDFGKTKLLNPGESEKLSFTINKEDLASYDSEGIKVKGGGYILEAGDYKISIRENSHKEIASESFAVAADIDYSKNKRESDKVAAVNHFEDYTRGKFTVLSRKDHFANYKEACGPLSEDAYVMDDATRKAVEEQSFAYYDPTKYDNATDTMPNMEQKNGLKLYDLVGASYDDEKWDKLLDQMSFDDMGTLINVGGWQTAAIKSISKPATVECDGPAGLNNFITQVYGTSFPGEILMAQSFNRELLGEIGEAIATEFKAAGYYGWYGPAANTHRSAFAGRNFEYYSEDGVLSGHLAAAEMNGAVQHKVYPYLKHFALNDQETNRCAFLLTFATEQTIRENYLKGFEIGLKKYEGNIQAMMSSFNFIGTVAGSANPELLNDVLRKEWGFQGMVITDYDGSYGYMISDKSVRNGNDLMLGFAMADSNKFTDKSATAVLAMRKACKNILYTVANSGVYDNGDPTGKMSNMDKIFLGVDILFAVLYLLCQFLLFKGWKKKKEALKLAAANPEGGKPEVITREIIRTEVIKEEIKPEEKKPDEPKE